MRSLLLALVLASKIATSGFSVQVASTSSRSEAERLVSTLVGRDLTAYWSEATVDGRTMYRVRVGSFQTRDQAKEFAESLPSDLGLQYWIAPDDRILPTPLPTPKPSRQPLVWDDVTPATSVQKLLDAARTAHGGERGGFAILGKADAIELRYRLKSVDAKSGEPVFTRHVYRRLGKDLRLDISAIEGKSAPSTTVVTKEGGWVDAGGKRGSVAAAAARARIEALGPAGMLRLPLAFPKEGAAAAGISGATLVGERTLNGEPALRLDASPAPAPYKEASLYLDPTTKRLIAARFLTDAGELLLELSDYKQIAPGLLVPMRRTVWRDGAIVSSVEIDELRLDPDLDATLFAR